MALTPHLAPSTPARPLSMAISRRRWLSCAGLAIALVLATAGVPAVASSDLQSDDEVWMVCTRHLTTDACAADLTQPNFAVAHFDGVRQFVPSTTAELLAAIQSDPTTANVIYAHGNRFDQAEAIRRGWRVYCRISAQQATAQKMRFIIWSWPSEQVGVLLKDARTKAERTDSQGLYMAWLLREMSVSPAPVTVIGYSFGGRVVTGCLHALAGGPLAGRRLPGAHIRGLPTNVGLIAPAVDREWLLAGSYHGLATKNMQRLLLMYNPRDVVLRQYWLIDLTDIARALGAVGPLQFGTRQDGTELPVIAVNCSRTVGRRHDEMDYLSTDCGGSTYLARLVENR